MDIRKKINGVKIRFTDESEVLPSVIAVSTERIAKIFNKDHRNVLRDFRNAIEKMEEIDELNSEQVSEQPLYANIKYIDEAGRKQPALAVSERLFYQVVLAYTGDKAFILRKEFIDTFFDMRVELELRTKTFINRSASQRDRRRKELKESYSKEISVLQAKIDHKNKLIAECMASLQEDVN